MKGTIGMKRDVRIGIKEPSPPKVPHRTRIKAMYGLPRLRLHKAHDAVDQGARR